MSAIHSIKIMTCRGEYGIMAKSEYTHYVKLNKQSISLFGESTFQAVTQTAFHQKASLENYWTSIHLFDPSLCLILSSKKGKKNGKQGPSRQFVLDTVSDIPKQ